MVSPPEIVVYGKPGCTQCFATTSILARRNVPYTYKDVSSDAEAFSTVEFLGYQSLPVVVAGDIHWSGYRHENIRRLINLYGKKETPE